MTKLSVYAELLHRGATESILGALIIGGVLAVVLISATFHTPQSGSIDKSVAPKAFVDSPRPAATPAVVAMKSAPMDALGKDLFWSPLTSDESN